MESLRHARVHPLGGPFYASAAELLAHAFFTNPCHIVMCPDPKTRLARLQWILGGNLRMHVESDPEASFCLGDDSVVDAMGFWTRPDSTEFGLLAKIRAGMLAAPFRVGLQGLRRILEVDRAVTGHRTEALGDAPCWYLNNMVVRESLRGTGVGTRLLNHQLHSVRQRDPGALTALATQRPENVSFYKRLGFEVVSERMIGGDAGSFRNWIMLYPPGADSKRSIPKRDDG